MCSERRVEERKKEREKKKIGRGVERERERKEVWRSYACRQGIDKGMGVGVGVAGFWILSENNGG